MNYDTPTEETYKGFQEAYSYFNNRLFGNDLPDCLITMQRTSRSYGYFCRRRFVNRNGTVTDEIALNPKFFAARTERGVLSTLAHEMAHLWQFHFGAKRGRAGYHNREWADRMIDIGLYPSSTAAPGGSETGYRVSHYIIEDGPFDAACGDYLTDGFALKWLENDFAMFDLTPPTSKAVKSVTDGSNRWKYTCPQCDVNAWGKPALALICGACRLVMPRNTRHT